MLLPAATQTTVPASAVEKTAPQQTWRRTQQPRTAGTMPVWGQPVPARQETQTRLASAAEEKNPLTGNNSVLALREDPAMTPTSAATEQTTDDDLSFSDLLDIVNPLQHLPVVGFVYRQVTGDTIKPMAQVIGGGLYGGLPGAAASMVNVAVEEATGKDIAGNMLALVDGEEPLSSAAATKSASRDPSPEARLTRIAQTYADSADYADLPGSTIGIANLAFPSARATTASPVNRNQV